MAHASPPVPVTGDAQVRNAATLLKVWMTNYSTPGSVITDLSLQSWVDFCNFGSGWASAYPQEMVWYWFNAETSDKISRETWQAKFDCMEKRHWYSLATHCFGDRYYEVDGWLTAVYGSFQAAFAKIAVGSGPGFEGVVTREGFNPTWNGQPDGPQCPAEDAFTFFDANGDGLIRAGEWAAAGKRMAFLRQAADSHSPISSLDDAIDSNMGSGPCGAVSSTSAADAPMVWYDGPSTVSTQTTLTPAKTGSALTFIFALLGILLLCSALVVVPMSCCARKGHGKVKSTSRSVKNMTPRPESQRDLEIEETEEIEELGYSTLPTWTQWVPAPIFQSAMAQSIMLEQPMQYTAVPTGMPPQIQQMQPQTQIQKVQVLQHPQQAMQMTQPQPNNCVARTAQRYLQVPGDSSELSTTGQNQGKNLVPAPLDSGYMSEDDAQIMRRALLEGDESEYVSTTVVRNYA
eukprot:gnl/MRDRNA2_/MRDRNA2_162041_c0_seq1.p1 gnl/MRDRNA2_/MRDRNA2_162041_c0~~gnl/MRDRNA2_/MRDRNA2_162041_c0_seq1.p1  ORF type:complete len:518 (+),score=89.02 gnl/MRDRNA2_/MRDRNA2_162041_c0_seq1:176-1555(+)